MVLLIDLHRRCFFVFQNLSDVGGSSLAIKSTSNKGKLNLESDKLLFAQVLYTVLLILQPVVNLLLTEYNAHTNRAIETIRKGI